jgi:hypothetical protein
MSSVVAPSFQNCKKTIRGPRKYCKIYIPVYRTATSRKVMYNFLGILKWVFTFTDMDLGRLFTFSKQMFEKIKNVIFPL